MNTLSCYDRDTSALIELHGIARNNPTLSTQQLADQHNTISHAFNTLAAAYTLDSKEQHAAALASNQHAAIAYHYSIRAPRKMATKIKAPFFPTLARFILSILTLIAGIWFTCTTIAVALELIADTSSSHGIVYGYTLLIAVTLAIGYAIYKSEE